MRFMKKKKIGKKQDMQRASAGSDMKALKAVDEPMLMMARRKMQVPTSPSALSGILRVGWTCNVAKSTSVRQEIWVAEQCSTHGSKKAREWQSFISRERPYEARDRCKYVEEGNKYDYSKHDDEQVGSMFGSRSFVVDFNDGQQGRCVDDLVHVTDSEEEAEDIGELHYAVHQDGGNHAAGDVGFGFFDFVAWGRISY